MNEDQDSFNNCEPPPFSLAACIVIILIFGAISVLTIVGNGIVIWIVLSTKQMRTVTNYFLVNLAVGDMLAVFQIIPNVYYVLLSDWAFGVAYCKFAQFFTSFGIAISVLTFTGLTADRYIAIKYPLRPRSSSSTILGIIGGIWLVSFIIGLPGLLTAKIFDPPPYNLNYAMLNITSYKNISSYLLDIKPNSTLITISKKNLAQCRVCNFDWSSNWGVAYDAALFLLMYILPLTILFATYVPIIIKLWSDRGLGEITVGQIENIKSKRKVVKMLISVMAIFAICWLPYQLFFLILHAPINKENPSLPVIFIVCYGLAMSNSMYNPIIYCTMNRRFRDGFLKIVGCSKKIQPKFQPNRFQRNFHSAVNSKIEV